MAQSAVTVTPPNPTPPTNFGAGIANANATPPTQAPYPTPGPTTPPPAVGYGATVYNDPWHPGATNPTHPAANNPSGAAVSTAPPYLDDGTAGTGTAFATPNSGTAAEGAGTEVVVTQTYNSAVLNPAGPLQTVSDLGNYVGGANSVNQAHASTLSPATAPALSSISPTTTTGGTGTVAVTATGTNFLKTSVIYADGRPLATTFTSSTTISANVPKKAAGGSTVINVVTGQSIVTPVAQDKTLSFT